MVLIFSSLITSDSEHLFIYLLPNCISSLKKGLFESFGHFLISFFFLSVVRISHIFWVLTFLSDTWFANIYSHSIICLFMLLIASLAVQFFSLMLLLLSFFVACIQDFISEVAGIRRTQILGIILHYWLQNLNLFF